jgi:hypothetical protein
MARIGRTEEAERLLARSATMEPGVGGFIAWWRSLALAGLELHGDPTPAASSLEALVAEAERQGLLLEAVWVRLDLGALLAGVDPKRAGQVLREAGARAERMRAATELRLAEQRLRALGVRTWRRGRKTAGTDPSRSSATGNARSPSGWPRAPATRRSPLRCSCPARLWSATSPTSWPSSASGTGPSWQEPWRRHTAAARRPRSRDLPDDRSPPLPVASLSSPAIGPGRQGKGEAPCRSSDGPSCWEPRWWP